MSDMKTVFMGGACLLAFAVCGVASAGESDNASCGQPGPLAAAACKKLTLEQADKQLNAAYRQAMSALQRQTPDPATGKQMQEKLKLAQRAWLQWKSAECELRELRSPGSPGWQAVDGIDCQTELTQARTVQLKALAD